MRLRIKLSIRLILLSLAAASLIILLTAQLVKVYFSKVAYTETAEVINHQANYYASLLKTQLETELNKIQTYSAAATNNNKLNINILHPQLKTIAQNNNSILSVWDTWEKSYTDSTYTEPFGRDLYTFQNNIDYISENLTEKDLNGDDYESVYYTIKTNNTQTITDAGWISSNSAMRKRQLRTQILVPHLKDNQFCGAVAIEYSLNNFYELIDSLNSRNDNKIMALTYEGTIVAHPNLTLIGKNISTTDTVIANRFNVIENIANGKQTEYALPDMYGNDSIYYALAPFTIGQTNKNWAILVKVPLVDIDNQVNNLYGVVHIISIVGLIILFIVVLIYSLIITIPLRRTKLILHSLAMGDVHNTSKLYIRSNDELGEMATSVNTLIDGINNVTAFAENIGNGNYGYKFELASSGDVLGNSIIEMRNSLQQAVKDEKIRALDEEHLNWASQGMNIFNRILRVDNDNFEQLTNQIIETLVNYLNAHMGGIYLKSDNNNTVFELAAHIGFNTQKYSKKTINPNDGIVGRCILEKETIYINEIPKDYVKISSGLGKSDPVSALIVPLMLNTDIIGIIEIESLKNIEKYQISFVEKLSETIASTISTVKSNLQTTILLDKSRKQAEELEQQEEEMRQNMEEMQATQEEAAKRESELTALIEGFNQMLMIVEYDLKQHIIDVNDNYSKVLNQPKQQLIGKQHRADLFMDEKDQAKHNSFWDTLLRGFVQENIEFIKNPKGEYWIHELYIPVKDEYGAIKKILCVGIDITEQKKVEYEIKQVQDGVYDKKQKPSKQKAGNLSINLDAKLEIIDLTYLKMVYKKDTTKIYNILKLYLDTLPAQIKELNEVHKLRDYNKLKSKINNLKTKMSYMGLKKVYENLRGVERILNEGKNFVEIPKMLTEIYKQWELAQTELRALLNLPAAGSDI